MKLEIGFRNRNKKGEWFEVVGYTENFDYVVRFDNGVQRKNTPKKKILNGTVSARKTPEPLNVNIGEKFGKLTVVGLDDPVNPTLTCDCGNSYSTPRYCLLNNLKTSCGCSPMKPATDTYWGDFNRWMKDWNPNTHKLSVKKLPLFSFKKGSTKFEKIVGFTYVDAEFYEYWKQFPFVKVGAGYACLANNAYVYDKIIGFGRNLKYTYKLHHLVKGHTNFGEYVVDHINGCKLDNRFKNLRTATKLENSRNQNKLKTKETSSIYKGVCFDKTRVGVNKKRKDKPWKAIIRVGDRSKTKSCHTEIEAAEWYNKFALEFYGEFAKLNVIKAP